MKDVVLHLYCTKEKNVIVALVKDLSQLLRHTNHTITVHVYKDTVPIKTDEGNKNLRQC